ncbi:twinfilin [Anaeramoeba ignava]|uniref:Twinfilin n=1 Tax=Anaeramoeba ignava TaxID=1746090 RepID=A0A9Q0LRB7_ANAIG|nr:twinfilin [Anaeramoeba ignava]KAJ5077274.1 twinfilin [Anaeramoeba ignava]
MTLSSKIKEKLQQSFESDKTRAIIIGFEQENELEAIYVMDDSLSTTSNSDFEKIKKELKADEPNYILYKLKDSPRNHPKWLLINFVPDDAKVREKMTYSSSTNILKNFVGKLLTDTWQVSDIKVFSWNDYQQSKDKSFKPWSRGEILRFKAREMEDTARFEMETQQSLTKKIGGYHSVEIPFNNEVENSIKEFINGEFNWIELQISQNKKEIIIGSKKRLQRGSPEDIKEYIDKDQPRFYLHQDRTVTHFIYSCPPNSPIQLRMVYSTAKPGITSQSARLGLTINRKHEIIDLDDLMSSYSRRRSWPGKEANTFSQFGYQTRRTTNFYNPQQNLRKTTWRSSTGNEPKFPKPRTNVSRTGLAFSGINQTVSSPPRTRVNQNSNTSYSPPSYRSQNQNTRFPRARKTAQLPGYVSWSSAIKSNAEVKKNIVVAPRGGYN